MEGLDAALTARFVERSYEEEILPALARYIEIPCKSPLFDPDWRSRGHLQRAVEEVAAWCRRRALPGLAVEVLSLPDRTPVLWMELPGEAPGRVLLYGHLDKQPEMEGWRPGLGPWKAVREGDRLYGRGGADDGYAAFAAVTALEALSRAGVPHAPCSVLIEASEESGSPDLPAYVAHLAPRIGEPDLVVCLDSGCGDYERLWVTTSLRGMVTGVLSVDVLQEGVHSGDAGGVVPSSFRILRELLSRLEDERTGEIRPAALHAEIPASRRAQADAAGAVLGARTHERFPFVPGAGPTSRDPADLVLRRTWRPALEITGLGGAPPPEDAGNVLRGGTRAKLSLRLPPGVDGAAATAHVKQLFEAEPSHGARVRFEAEAPATGWNAPLLLPWLERALDEASRAHYGAPAVQMGEGGTIPFIAMLAERFPRAQLLVTGVLGPGANAHGPNEFLHVPAAKRLTACVAHVLAAHGRAFGGA